MRSSPTRAPTTPSSTTPAPATTGPRPPRPGTRCWTGSAGTWADGPGPAAQEGALELGGMAMLVLRLRAARARARAAAVAEALALLHDLGPAAPAGGPLA